MVMLTATRIEPRSNILYLLHQSSPTSPKMGDITNIPKGANSITKSILTEKGEILTSIPYLQSKKVVPVTVIMATAKSKKRPDFVVMQVVLYRLEKEGGQHKDTD